MAGVQYKKEVAVGIEDFYKAVISFSDYPKFVSGVQNVYVQKQSATEAVVEYHVNMIKEIKYTLKLQMHAPDKVSWSFLDGDIFKKNDGAWIMKALGPQKTLVEYSLDVEAKMFVPKMIINSLTGSSLPKMVEEMENYAKRMVKTNS